MTSEKAPAPAVKAPARKVATKKPAAKKATKAPARKPAAKRSTTRKIVPQHLKQPEKNIFGRKPLPVRVGNVGTPGLYSKQIIEWAIEYLQDWHMYNYVPQVAALCLYIGISRDTLYRWIKDDDKKELSDIVLLLMKMQEMFLQDGGLGGQYHPVIAKLLLAKHGYAEKTETDLTSSDGSMKSYTPEDYARAQAAIEAKMGDMD